MAQTITLKDDFMNLGTNVKVAQSTDGMIIIQIDPTKEGGFSKSGKTISIASTAGNQKVGRAAIGINVYRYPETAEEKAESKRLQALANQ